MTILDDLVAETREFARQRDWSVYHTPKNLAMAVASEAGELLAELRWLSDEASRLSTISDDRLEAVRLEMADVFIFLLRMADVLEVDLARAVRDKLALNERRFPRPEPSTH